MQFVLDDQIWRIERPTVAKRPPKPGFGRAIEPNPGIEAVDMAEESAGFPNPWQAREFVDRRDEKCRQAPINRLIDGQDGKRTVADEIAGRVGATDFHVREARARWECRRRSSA